LRRRVKEAVEGHIDQERWAKLRETEALEQRSLETFMRAWRES
jgi:hypothetical protein